MKARGTADARALLLIAIIGIGGFVYANEVVTFSRAAAEQVVLTLVAIEHALSRLLERVW